MRTGWLQERTEGVALALRGLATPRRPWAQDRRVPRLRSKDRTPRGVSGWAQWVTAFSVSTLHVLIWLLLLPMLAAGQPIPEPVDFMTVQLRYSGAGVEYVEARMDTTRAGADDWRDPLRVPAWRFMPPTRTQQTIYVGWFDPPQQAVEIKVPLDGRSDTVFVVIRAIPVELINGSARATLAIPNRPQRPGLTATDR